MARPTHFVALLAFALAFPLTPSPSRAQEAGMDAVAARVADAVCDRQVVLLGELPSHGEGRAFEIKAKVVQRLVERCHFGALLFEAPIYDFVGFRDALSRRAATPTQLDRAIGRFWLTRELAEWRQWLFARAMDGTLVLGGLDDQVSVTSDHARATLPALVAASLPAAEAPACEQAVSRHLEWRYDAATPFDAAEQLRLERCVVSAADAQRARTASATRPGDAVMLENLANYVKRQRDATAARDRDEMMYRNVRWHAAHASASRKVLIWTATVHASRTQATLKQRPLGAWFTEAGDQGVAAIGFSAFGGWSSMAGRAAKALPQALPGSLEGEAVKDGAPWRYLDASALRGMGRVPSRLLGSVVEGEWWRHFDGVVVIRDEVAPTFDVAK